MKADKAVDKTTDNTTDKNLKVIDALATTLEQYKLTRIRYQKGDLKIDLEQQAPQIANVMTAGTLPQTSANIASTADPTDESTKPAGIGDTVVSPFVGTAYLSPSPEMDPFVKVGDIIKEGDTVLIVESMKVMTPIPAPCSGKVHSILIGNGEPVEYGQELLSIVRR